MPKILILRGLPASGKSTYARELIHTKNYKRVNKDEIRNMVDDGKFSRANEKIVIKTRDSLIVNYLNGGYNVVVDDTNLHEKHITRIKQIAKQVSSATGKSVPVSIDASFLQVPLEECIYRDLKRDKSVGERVIKKMDRQFFGSKKRVPMLQNRSLQGAVIVDIDGTLALMKDRGPYEWSKVGQDDPNANVINLVRMLHDSGKTIIFMSGRDSVCRGETIDWLKKHINLPMAFEDQLFMRPAKDNRKDTIIKAELFDNNIAGKYNVSLVLDDRNGVVEMWRNLGLTCLQVADGDF